jgi:hypothetical protein
VPSSSSAVRREYPTTSATTTAASFLSGVVVGNVAIRSGAVLELRVCRRVPRSGKQRRVKADVAVHLQIESAFLSVIRLAIFDPLIRGIGVQKLEADTGSNLIAD